VGLSQPRDETVALSSQSIGASTSVAMEFRKSRPGESAMKFAGGLGDTIQPNLPGLLLTSYAVCRNLKRAY